MCLSLLGALLFFAPPAVAAVVAVVVGFAQQLLLLPFAVGGEYPAESSLPLAVGRKMPRYQQFLAIVLRTIGCLDRSITNQRTEQMWATQGLPDAPSVFRYVRSALRTLFLGRSPAQKNESRREKPILTFLYCCVSHLLRLGGRCRLLHRQRPPSPPPRLPRPQPPPSSPTAPPRIAGASPGAPPGVCS